MRELLTGGSPATTHNKVRRHQKWAVLQLSGVGILLGALLSLGLVVSAGATGPSSGSQVSGVLQPQSGFTPGIPFASGQNVNIVIPANNTFSSTDGLNNNNSAINVLECSAPNGVIPTQPSACDGNTIQGNTILPALDGSFTYDNYTIYALPDGPTFGESPGGPVCGITAATECVLYIGNNQGDFTQPHLWSTPFYIKSNSTDSGIPAGDGSAPAVATQPDPSISTVVASPSTAAADGVDLSTVTVTLLGTGSVPVPGKTVSLTPTSCTPSPCAAKVTIPSPDSSDANGQLSFTVTDAMAQAVTLTASDTTDSVTLNNKATVTFQPAAVEGSHSTVSANPTTVGAAGSTTITVTLRDQGANPQPVSGKAVTLARSNGSSAVITPSANPDLTNASGEATFTVTDPAAETVTFTATDSTDSIVLSNTVQVTFGTLTVDATKSTVSVLNPNPAPLGSAGTTAVVQLETSSGSPVSGKTVSLKPAAGTSVVVGSPTPSTTGADGKVSFSLTDTVAETVALTATDTTDNVPLSTGATVTFAPSAPSATVSNVLASGTTSPADGETQTLIRVIVTDQFGTPIPGKTVTMQGSPGGNVQVHPVAVGGTGTPGVSNSSGEVDFNADDTVAETVTFTATDTTDNITLAKTVSVTYLAGPADPASIGTTVTANPTNPPADGTTPSTITVTLTDFFSNPVAGKSISLKGLNGSSTISPATVVTDQSGQAQFSAKDSTAEVVTFQATDNTDSNAVIDAEAVVTFGNPPAAPPNATFCSVTANPTSVPADGSKTATVSVLLYDNNGDPVSGKTVTLAESGGNPKVTATNATSNNSGMATFAVSDTTAESVKFTATDTTDNIPLTADPVTVTFTASGAADTTTTSTTTTTTTTTTSPTGGTTTTTATSGATVTGSSTGGTSGNTGAGASSPATLATTGAGMFLPWLFGFGVLFFVAGTIGRRRFKRHQHAMGSLNE